METAGKNHLYRLRAGVESVGYEFLNRFVGASVQTFRKQLDNPVAQADIDLIRLVTYRYK